MANDFLALPPDSTGKKLRTRSSTVSGNVVHEQATYRAGAQTFYAYADNVAFAANKHHISLFNAVGSGLVLQVRKLFPVNLASAAVAGVAIRFDVKRTTTQTLGTAVAMNPADTTNTSLPATILCASGATITESALLFPYMSLNEEVTATQGLITAHFQQSVNVLLEEDTMQELTLREGQGFTVKQITSSVVGSFGWIVGFTSETP